MLFTDSSGNWAFQLSSRGVYRCVSALSLFRTPLVEGKRIGIGPNIRFAPIPKLIFYILYEHVYANQAFLGHINVYLSPVVRVRVRIP